MNRPPDLLLTFILLGPVLAVVIATLAPRWYAAPAGPEGPRPRRRLTDEEMRRLHPMIAERMGRFQRN